MQPPHPVFLFTDFGWSGPYVGQMTAAVMRVDTRIPVVHLMHDAPSLRPDLAAYLLAACCHYLPDGAVVVAVVDPGVGGPRDALVVGTDRLVLVGPDNGLLSRVAGIERVRRVRWRPDFLSTSFHGRDLFAPVGARLATGDPPDLATVEPRDMVGADWAEDLEAVIHVDDFGNVVTGVRGSKVPKNKVLLVAGRRLAFAPTFSAVGEGELFWYVDSQGLVEFAGNRVSAADLLSLAIGDRFLLD